MSKTFYSDLPEDPEQIFLHLEERYREDLDRKTAKIDWDEYFPAAEALEYMRRTTAAAQELAVSFVDELEVPLAQNLSRNDYYDFRGKVDHISTALQIRHARRELGYSVRFDNKTKQKLLHYLKSIKDIILKLDDIDDWKREALLNKLTELEKEVSRDRFQYKILAAFIIEASGVVGEAAKRLEPARKLIDSISHLLYGAKQSEHQSLPPPTTPKLSRSSRRRQSQRRLAPRVARPRTWMMTFHFDAQHARLL
jgi:hypothetical protein